MNITVRQVLREVIAIATRTATGEGRGRQLYLNAASDVVRTVAVDVAKREGHELGILQEYVSHGTGTSMHMIPDALNYPVK